MGRSDERSIGKEGREKSRSPILQNKDDKKNLNWKTESYLDVENCRISKEFN